MSGQAVLVTGAGKRVGAALAEALGTAGWAVFVHYNRSSDDAEAVAARIERAGGRARTVGGNLSDPETPARIMAECAHVPDMPLRALVNNASVFDYDTAETFSRAVLDKQLAVNTIAPVALSHAFAGALPKGAHGAVVNFLDQKLWNLNPDFFSYTISKYALRGATELLAQALAPRVRVNAVAPGLTLPSGGQSAADFDAVKARNLLRRRNEVSDLIGAVRFLLETPWVNGQAIRADSGEHLLPADPESLQSARPQ
jgi:NAD(P)-dependent dehydrogenase (short-subunit alcohol dehydrogenase family)